MNNQNGEEKAITLADLWRVFLTALPLMIIAAILIVGIGYAYRKLTYRPEYTSEGAFRPTVRSIRRRAPSS